LKLLRKLPQQLQERAGVLAQKRRPEREDGTPFRVLSLDGGGLKGRALVEMLRQVETRLREQQGDEFTLRDHFDLIVGTSTGALVGMGIVYFDFSCDELDAMFDVIGYEVFESSKLMRSSRASSNSSSELAFYSTDKLDKFLKLMLTPPPSVECPNPPSFCLSAHENGQENSQENDVKLAMVAADWKTGAAETFLFRNYFSIEPDAFRGSCTAPIHVAARATSAAPTYFKSVKEQVRVDGEDRLCNFRFVDGGVLANNPTLIALTEAFRYSGDRNIQLLSLGCGMPDRIHCTANSLLIENLAASATNVRRTERLAESLVARLSGVTYWRFSPTLNRNIDLADNREGAVKELLAAVAEITGSPPSRGDETDAGPSEPGPIALSFAEMLNDLCPQGSMQGSNNI